MNSEVKIINNHYQLPLPLLDHDIRLPNNRNQALRRLQSLRKRFSLDHKYRQDYTDFMNDMLAKGYDKKSTSEEDGVWYIPHHGV